MIALMISFIKAVDFFPWNYQLENVLYANAVVSGTKSAALQTDEYDSALLRSDGGS
jgi:hypothetical protein